MSKKYVINIFESAQMVEQIGVNDKGEAVVCSTLVENLEELNSDYINEHFGELQDTAYKRGLDDAWEAARKIAAMWETMDNDDLLETFGVTAKIGESVIGTLFKKQTANEAMLELEVYEEKQKVDDKIEVGDEVIYNGTTKCVVVTPETDEKYASLFDCNGIHYSADHRECKKTGRHFDIASILEDMRHD